MQLLVISTTRLGNMGSEFQIRVKRPPNVETTVKRKDYLYPGASRRLAYARGIEGGV